jgi:hypothetical protein
MHRGKINHEPKLLGLYNVPEKTEEFQITRIPETLPPMEYKQSNQTAQEKKYE